METWIKKCLWRYLKVLGTCTLETWSVSSKRHYMNSNRPLGHGTSKLTPYENKDFSDSSSYNHNFYMFFEANLCVITVLCVDDLLIMGTHEAKVIELEQKLEQEFEMSILELLTT